MNTLRYLVDYFTDAELNCHTEEGTNCVAASKIKKIRKSPSQVFRICALGVINSYGISNNAALSITGFSLVDILFEEMYKIYPGDQQPMPV